MSAPLAFLTIGLGAGCLAGLFGVGGGAIILPALMYFYGFTQVQATGTSLVALLAPVGLGGALAYWREGKIDASHLKAGLLISIGMFVGSYVGAKMGSHLPPLAMKRGFSVFLVLLAIRLWA